MASAVEKVSSQLAGGSSVVVADMETDEDELFEIDLELVNNIPPPHYWDSYFTATSSTLLANCLLPISDVCNAVPMVSTALKALTLAEQLMLAQLQSPHQPIKSFWDSAKDSMIKDNKK